MRVVCAWCSRVLKPGEGEGDPVVSHGICAHCNAVFVKGTESTSLEKLLAEWAAPVLVVGGAGEVVAANDAACSLAGLPLDAMRGAPGGDVLQCVHAREPGGCGGTEHCLGCTIRRTVDHTRATGEAAHAVAAEQYVGDGRRVRSVHFRISTRRRGALVLLSLQPTDPTST